MGFTGAIDKYARSATLVVAASDSREIFNADYICDGVSDEDEINAAIASLSAGGGVVFLLDGTYVVDGPIIIDKNNVALVGTGAGTVIKIVDNHNTNINVISANTMDHLLIANLRIDGNRANQTAGTMHGIFFGTVTHSKILSCWSENMRNYGIRIYPGSHNIVVGNHLRNNHFNGISLSGADNNIVVGNDSLSSDDSGITLYYSDNNTVIGNNCQSNSYDGIYVAGSNNNTITGNNCQSNGRRGVHLNLASNNTIVSNTVMGNSQTTDNAYDGIYVEGNSDYNNIQGNTVRHAGGANQHRYGIRIQNATGDGNLIINNDLYNAGRTLDYSDAGTGTIYQNNRTTAGWVP